MQKELVDELAEALQDVLEMVRDGDLVESEPGWSVRYRLEQAGMVLTRYREGNK